MPLTPGDRPDVFPSEVDPAFDCVRVEAQTPEGTVATPPSADAEPAGEALCPDGYVPRRRAAATTWTASG